MKLGKVAVCILTWNGRTHLETCLPALRDQRPAGVETEILLLDNGSWDGTAAWVESHHPEVRLVASPVNLGFCAGNNRLVAATDADAIVFLNNDTRPAPDWLATLIAALASAPDDVAAVSGLIVDWTGDRLDFARGVWTFDGHAFQKDYGRPLAGVRLPESGSELPFACGGNMIVRRDAFLAAGGFDPAYFAYLEDVDLGWRLWSGGWRVVLEPAAKVHHRSMATSALLGNDHRGFLFERNAFLTVYKNYEDDLWQRWMPAVLLTLSHRTQTLMVQNNPGGQELTYDPYAGLIANTAVPPQAPAAGPAAPPAEPPPSPSLTEKWRLYGRRDFVRRGLRKAVRKLTPRWLWEEIPGSGAAAHLVDGRTVAQLRAITQLWAHLDRAADQRQRVQARRTRSDREIFERFPLYLVPTYPGDERLFASPGFRAWLPEDVPRVEASLEEIMAATTTREKDPDLVPSPPRGEG